MAAYTAIASADITLSSTWSPTGVPGSSDTATIPTGYNCTLANGETFNGGTLTLAGTGTLTTTGTCSITGTLSLTGTAATAVTVSSGTLTVASTSCSVGSTIISVPSGATLNVTTVLMSANGQYISVTGTCSVTNLNTNGTYNGQGILCNSGSVVNVTNISSSGGAYYNPAIQVNGGTVTVGNGGTGTLTWSQNAGRGCCIAQTAGTLVVNGVITHTINIPTSIGEAFVNQSGGTCTVTFQSGSNAFANDGSGGGEAVIYQTGGTLTTYGMPILSGWAYFLVQDSSSATATLNSIGTVSSCAVLPEIVSKSGTITLASGQTVTVPANNKLHIGTLPQSDYSSTVGSINISGVSFSVAGSLFIGALTIPYGWSTKGTITTNSGTLVTLTGNGGFSQVGTSITPNTVNSNFKNSYAMSV